MPSEEILNEFTKEESERKRQMELCGSDVEGCNDEHDRDGVQSGSGGDSGWGNATGMARVSGDESNVLKDPMNQLRDAQYVMTYVFISLSLCLYTQSFY